jgi:MFS family permease
VTNPRALRVLFVCLVCIRLGQSMLFAILPPAARALGISPFRISTIFASSASIWVFVSPWWGRKSDVWGRRPVILVGLLGFGRSMTLLATTIALGRGIPVGGRGVSAADRVALRVAASALHAERRPDERAPPLRTHEPSHSRPAELTAAQRASRKRSPRTQPPCSLRRKRSWRQASARR